MKSSVYSSVETLEIRDRIGIQLQLDEIEKILIDPPAPWVHETFPGQTAYRENSQAIMDALTWVDTKIFPTVPSFCEALRGDDAWYIYLPVGPCLGDLKPGQSKLNFLHSRVIPKGSYALCNPPRHGVPKIQRNEGNQACHHPLWHPRGADPCIYDLWDLSTSIIEPYHRVQRAKGRHGEPYGVIATRHCIYAVGWPITQPNSSPIEYDAGIFLSLPIGELIVEYAGEEPHPDTLAALGDNLSICSLRPMQ